MNTTTAGASFVAHTARGPLSVSVSTDWQTGRTRYAVDRIGTFIIEPNPHDYPTDDAARLRIQYGDDAGPGEYRARHGYRPRPNAPTINTLRLVGNAVVNPDRATPENDCWLVVRRYRSDDSTPRAPEATARRAAQIVYALIRHYQTRPDLNAVKLAQARALAPERLRSTEATINHLRDQIAELQARLAQVEHAAAVQRALIENTPLP